MSSGFSKLLDQLFRPGKRIEQRVTALRDVGLTVDLEHLAPNARVVEIDLGFGPENWLAPDGPVEIARPASVAGGTLLLDRGSLILAAGRPATTRLLRSRGIRPERIPTRL